MIHSVSVYTREVCFSDLPFIVDALRIHCICLQCGRPGFDPWVGMIPWRRKWQPTPVLLPGESHGWRSLVGYSPWGRKESDTTEQLHFDFLRIPSAFFLLVFTRGCYCSYSLIWCFLSQVWEEVYNQVVFPPACHC